MSDQSSIPALAPSAGDWLKQGVASATPTAILSIVLYLVTQSWIAQSDKTLQQHERQFERFSTAVEKLAASTDASIVKFEQASRLFERALNERRPPSP